MVSIRLWGKSEALSGLRFESRSRNIREERKLTKLIKGSGLLVEFLFVMNPITSTVAASCNRLVLSPRSSPRGSPRSSPRSSPNALRKPPFLDVPNDAKRRDSKEIVDYKKQLGKTTSKAYRAEKTESNKSAEINTAKVNSRQAKQKPPKRLLEVAVHAATAERKTKTTNEKSSSTTDSPRSKKGKNCTIMWLSWFLIALSSQYNS